MNSIPTAFWSLPGAALLQQLAKIVERKGGHRLGGNYAPVAEEILSEVR